LFDDRLRILLQLFTDWLLFNDSSNQLDFDWFFQGPGGNHLTLGMLCMTSQIKAGAITVSCHFNPSITAFNFCVPAVSGVVSHFIASVLPEPDTRWMNTVLSQEQICSRHKVRNSLVTNLFCFNCFLQGEIMDEWAI
jgi:hypothetical protein